MGVLPNYFQKMSIGLNCSQLQSEHQLPFDVPLNINDEICNDYAILKEQPLGKPTKFNGMMHDYCVNKGWCGSIVEGSPSHVRDFIPAEGLVSADQFVTWLMKAEGVDPSKIGIRKELIQVFIKHMGSYKVEASLLR